MTILTNDIEKTILSIKNLFTEKDIDKIKNNDYDFSALLHNTLGRRIRNKYLWEGKSQLYKDLKNIGLNHPDDMSGFLITCAVKDIQNKNRNVDEQIELYKKYWKNV